MKLEIIGFHTAATNKQQKYIETKIGNLEKYIPRNSRDVAYAVVKLRETKIKKLTRPVCEVNLKLPKDTLIISETADTIFAAIDIAETKLKLEIKKYKEKHADPKLRQKFINRLQSAKSL